MAEPFIGQVDLLGFNFVPEHWAQCAGGIMQISANQALFSLLGTFYGGDGRTTFGLPDLRGRMAISQGNFPGSRYDWNVGDTGGSETHTLSVRELPSHFHSSSFTASGGGEVEFQISKDSASINAPAEESYVASTSGIAIYRPDAGSGAVSLGGVSGGGGISSGTVSVGTTGSNNRFNIEQPTSILNYCIALLGLFPSRN